MGVCCQQMVQVLAEQPQTENAALHAVGILWPERYRFLEQQLLLGALRAAARAGAGAAVGLAAAVQQQLLLGLLLHAASTPKRVGCCSRKAAAFSCLILYACF